MKREPDHELEALLSLDGQEFKFAGGHVVKYKVRRVSPDRGRPQGISYSLTLHDPRGKRYLRNRQTRTRCVGSMNLIIAIDILRTELLLTNTAVRSACWKIFWLKWKES